MAGYKPATVDNWLRDEVPPDHVLLTFDDAYQPDVFHAALANDKMIFIENAQDPKFAGKLPRWFKDALPTAHSFMILPLTVHRHPIGLIYGD